MLQEVDISSVIRPSFIDSLDHFYDIRTCIRDPLIKVQQVEFGLGLRHCGWTKCYRMFPATGLCEVSKLRDNTLLHRRCLELRIL